MQHKRNSSKKVVFILVFVSIVGGGIFLMAKPIPAPQQPIEKELDAQALLAPKAN